MSGLTVLHCIPVSRSDAMLASSVWFTRMMSGVVPCCCASNTAFLRSAYAYCPSYGCSAGISASNLSPVLPVSFSLLHCPCLLRILLISSCFLSALSSVSSFGSPSLM